MLKRLINLGIYGVVFLLPCYLIRFKIGWAPFNLLEVLIYGVFCLWLFQQIKEKKFFRNFEDKLYGPVFLILIGATLSVWFSSDVIVSGGIWKGWIMAPLFFGLVVRNNIKNRQEVKNIFLALFLGGVGVALIAFIYWIRHQLTYDGRLRAFYLSPNYLAMYLAPVLVLSSFLFALTKKKCLKVLLILGYGLLLGVIYLTYSYGAWLGLLAGFIFLAAEHFNKKIFLIFLLIMVLCLGSQIPTPKFRHLLDFSYASFQSRLMIWQSAWEIIKDHPFKGIGLGMFQKYYLEYQVKFKPYLEWAVPHPHNLFLAFWLQAGLLGLIGFCWLLISFFKLKNLSFEIIILKGTMLYFLVHGLVDTTYWKNDLAVLFWLVVGLAWALQAKSQNSEELFKSQHYKAGRLSG